MTPDFADALRGNAPGSPPPSCLIEQRIRSRSAGLSGARARGRCGHLRGTGQAAPDPERLEIRIPRRLPVNELERAQALSLMKGILPDKTLQDNAPILPRDAVGEE